MFGLQTAAGIFAQLTAEEAFRLVVFDVIIAPPAAPAVGLADVELAGQIGLGRKLAPWFPSNEFLPNNYPKRGCRKIVPRPGARNLRRLSENKLWIYGREDQKEALRRVVWSVTNRQSTTPICPKYSFFLGGTTRPVRALRADRLT